LNGSGRENTHFELWETIICNPMWFIKILDIHTIVTYN
jgi:hypothetical protein